MNKDQIISSFKADFAELLAKYDAEMVVKQLDARYYSFPSRVVFSIRTSDISSEDVDVGLWCSKDSV